MAFKRALWHSGLTYQQTCYHCRTLVRYTDYNLDFRPWYPDGFVYCPNCKGPLRHNEMFAINEDGTPLQPQAAAVPQGAPVQPQAAPVQPQGAPVQPQTAPTEGTPGFCSNCGKPVVLGVDRFCSSCGNKLD